MPDSNMPPAARISIGPAEAELHWTPQASRIPDAVPGTAALTLGYTADGHAVILATSSLQWLDDLESAIQVTRAQAIVQAGMAVPS